GDEFKSGDGGGQIAVVQAGTVGGGGDGPGHRDVRQGSEVVQGEAALVDDGGELAVFDSRAYGRDACFLVDVDRVEGFERDLILGTVGDGREGVARAQGAKFRATLHHLLHLFDRGGGVQLI